MDETRTQLTGHIGRGEHPHHTGHRLRRRRVDREHIGAGVLGKMHRAVEQPRDAHVVDEVALAERELGRLVLHPARADPTGAHRHRHLVAGE